MKMDEVKRSSGNPETKMCFNRGARASPTRDCAPRPSESGRTSDGVLTGAVDLPALEMAPALLKKKPLQTVRTERRFHF